MTATTTDHVEQLSAPAKVHGSELGVPNAHLAEVSAAAGFTSTIGTVAFVGGYPNGTFAVQFNNSNGGYSSAWPAWAYEQAKAALLANKKLWVGANGDPFGSNLVYALVMA